MIVQMGDKYYTKMRIQPSKQLWKQIDDWPRRIATKVTDFKEGKDYEIKFETESK